MAERSILRDSIGIPNLYDADTPVIVSNIISASRAASATVLVGSKKKENTEKTIATTIL